MDETQLTHRKRHRLSSIGVGVIGKRQGSSGIGAEVIGDVRLVVYSHLCGIGLQLVRAFVAIC